MQHGLWIVVAEGPALFKQNLAKPPGPEAGLFAVISLLFSAKEEKLADLGSGLLALLLDLAAPLGGSAAGAGDRVVVGRLGFRGQRSMVPAGPEHRLNDRRHLFIATLTAADQVGHDVLGLPGSEPP